MSSPESSLPEAWVQRIFATMRATYGAAFDRQWECPAGADPVEFAKGLMAHWGRELRGFQQHPHAIGHALDNLPEHPPNLVQFRALCTRRPEAAPALPAPKADPERVAQIVGRIARPAARDPRQWARDILARHAARDPRQWARDILARHAAGEHVAIASLDMARAAVRHQPAGAEQ